MMRIDEIDWKERDECKPNGPTHFFCAFIRLPDGRQLYIEHRNPERYPDVGHIYYMCPSRPGCDPSSREWDRDGRTAEGELMLQCLLFEYFKNKSDQETPEIPSGCKQT